MIDIYQKGVLAVSLNPSKITAVTKYSKDSFGIERYGLVIWVDGGNTFDYTWAKKEKRDEYFKLITDSVDKINSNSTYIGSKEEKMNEILKNTIGSVNDNPKEED